MGGQAISLTGDAAFLVALGWRVTERGGSLAFVLAVEWFVPLAWRDVRAAA